MGTGKVNRKKPRYTGEYVWEEITGSVGFLKFENSELGCKLF